MHSFHHLEIRYLLSLSLSPSSSTPPSASLQMIPTSDSSCHLPLPAAYFPRQMYLSFRLRSVLSLTKNTLFELSHSLTLSLTFSLTSSLSLYFFLFQLVWQTMDQEDQGLISYSEFARALKANPTS